MALYTVLSWHSEYTIEATSFDVKGEGDILTLYDVGTAVAVFADWVSIMRADSVVEKTRRRYGRR